MTFQSHGNPDSPGLLCMDIAHASLSGICFLVSMIPAPALIDHLSVLMTTSSPHINLTIGKPESWERNENVVNIDEGDYYLSLSILVQYNPGTSFN